MAFSASLANVQPYIFPVVGDILTLVNIVKQDSINILVSIWDVVSLLGLVDPKKGVFNQIGLPLLQLKLRQQPFFMHYLLIWIVYVMRDIPTAFWKGPHVLRAMTVYLRELIYVRDVAADDAEHV